MLLFAEDEELAYHVIQDHDHDLRNQLDHHFIETQPGDEHEQDQLFHTEGRETAAVERDGLLQFLLPGGRSGFKYPPGVGEIGERDGTDPADDVAGQHVHAQRITAQPVGNKTYNGGKTAEDQVKKNLFVFDTERFNFVYHLSLPP